MVSVIDLSYERNAMLTLNGGSGKGHGNPKWAFGIIRRALADGRAIRDISRNQAGWI